MNVNFLWLIVENVVQIRTFRTAICDFGIDAVDFKIVVWNIDVDVRCENENLALV